MLKLIFLSFLVSLSSSTDIEVLNGDWYTVMVFAGEHVTREGIPICPISTYSKGRGECEDKTIDTLKIKIKGTQTSNEIAVAVVETYDEVLKVLNNSGGVCKPQVAFIHKGDYHIAYQNNVDSHGKQLIGKMVGARVIPTTKELEKFVDNVQDLKERKDGVVICSKDLDSGDVRKGGKGDATLKTFKLWGQN